jgi:hypothetical protein
MVVGVAFLAVLATIMTVLVLGNGGRTPSGSATPSPSASATASAASASASPTSSATASASISATPQPVAIALDTIVATSVENLSLRGQPGTSATRLGSLELGRRTFVLGGPTDAEGYRWYLVSGLGLPPSAGCEEPIETDPFNCPYWFGWVAAAATDGTPWLMPAPGECPPEAPSATQLIVGVTNLERLACYGSTPITFRAWWPEIPDDAGLGGACAGQGHPSGWLLCQNINYDMVTIDESEGFGGVGVRLSTDPASGISMPERGTWVEVRAHLDDPAAQGCDEAAAFGDDDRPPEQIVLDCRSELVLEAATAVDGP